MFDPCGSLVMLLMFVVPPAAICWTVAVGVTRYLRDRPVTPRQSADAAATGCWLLFLWLFMTFSLAIVVGGAAAIPFLALSEVFETLPLAAAVVTLAIVSALGYVTWNLFWPMLAEEWRRLTNSDASFDDRASEHS